MINPFRKQRIPKLNYAVVRVFPLILSLGFLSACTSQNTQPNSIPRGQIQQTTSPVEREEEPSTAPSKTAVPTLIAPTSDATATRTPIPSHTSTFTPTQTYTPTSSSTPTETLIPSNTPTATQTPRPEIPPAAIRILSPAPLSKVSSPIQVRAILAPGYQGSFHIELLGEDGRLLSRQVLKYPGERVNTNLELDFEIPGVAETARIQIYTMDEYGRMIALGSSNIILMSIGRSEYMDVNDLRERIFILEPTEEDIILGGSLTVVGKAWPTTDQEPLLVELIAENGRVVGQRLIRVEAEPGEDYATFSAEIPYQINETTPVRLTIYEDIDRIDGKTHISTLEINLNP